MKITKLAECAIKVWQKFERGMLPQYSLITTEYVIETGDYAASITENIEEIQKI